MTSTLRFGYKSGYYGMRNKGTKLGGLYSAGDLLQVLESSSSRYFHHRLFNSRGFFFSK